MRVLITGGAGFIGTHLTRRLLAKGHTVTVLDNFSPQVHGGRQTLADDIAPHVQLVVGDVSDPAALELSLKEADAIVHLAAETGTGQSMYEAARYAGTNVQGTALLYDLLTKIPKHKVCRVIVASSRAIYGEGAYRCMTHGVVYPTSRTIQDKKAGHFDPVCPICLGVCESVPTTESARLQALSFYGLTKQVQEQTVLLFGRTLDIGSIALRYQNVYGPGQSLKNPYTGILAIFSNLARIGSPIRVFEDGAESRDFVFIDDVVSATERCLSPTLMGSHSINIGSGARTTVLEIAKSVRDYYASASEVRVTGDFRDGDIRHCTADLTLASSLLDYAPTCSFADGLSKFLEWAEQSEPSVGGYDRSLDELKKRGFLHVS